MSLILTSLTAARRRLVEVFRFPLYRVLSSEQRIDCPRVPQGHHLRCYAIETAYRDETSIRHIAGSLDTPSIGSEES